MKDDNQWEGWNWTEFWKGKLSNKFIAFIVYMVYMFLTSFIPNVSNNDVLWASTIVTVIFMLAGSIDTAVSNAKITADFKAGIQKDISATVNKVMEGKNGK